MSPQKIIVPILVLIIFITIVIFGLKGLSEKEGAPPTAGGPETPVSPAPEGGEESAPAGQGETPGGETGEIPIGPEVPAETEEGPLALPGWADPKHPMQSLPVEASEIPKEAVKVGISAEGITPVTFEVKKGQTVILAVTSKDEWTHIFKFRDKKLADVAVGVGPGQTRVITFYAPKEKGEYEFFCDVPGHEARGEKGVMVVK